MSVLAELIEDRDKSVAELEGITSLAENEQRDLTEDEETRSTELLSHVEEIDGRIAEEKVQEQRRRNLAEARSLIDVTKRSGSDAKVTSEPRVYGPDSPNSYFADIARTHMHSPMELHHQRAAARLTEWSHQVEREIALGTKDGKIAEGQFREQYRKGAVDAKAELAEARRRGSMSIEEKRAGITTGGGATASAAGGGGAAFVSPVFFLQDYAPYREFGRAFVDQCNKQPLPDYGMDVYIPAVTGPAAVLDQTEGSPVTETDPTAGYLSGSLTTKLGQVTVSQQLLDRAGPGFAFDKLVFDQLSRDYAPKIDAYALNAALSGAGSVAYSTTPFALNSAGGAGGLYSKIAQAKSIIRSTAGTVLNPSHLFMVPSRWEFISAWADGNSRPLVVPDYAGAWNAAAAGNNDGDEGIEGNTGYRMNGLRVFQDANIPAPGTGADQIIVGDLSEVYVFEGSPVTRAVPQTLAQNLQVILQLYSYVTAVVRYPLGIQKIAGAGLQTITW